MGLDPAQGGLADRAVRLLADHLRDRLRGRPALGVRRGGSAAASAPGATRWCTSSLLKIAPLRAGLVGLFSQNLILMGVFFTVPLYLQLVIGLDALETGLKMLPVSIAMFLASAAGSRLSTRFPSASIVRAGLATAALATVDARSPPSSRSSPTPPSPGRWPCSAWAWG